MAMTLRPTPEQDAKITVLAEAEGLSKHEAVLRVIEDAVDRRVHSADRQQFTAEVQAQFGDVIRRLGE